MGVGLGVGLGVEQSMLQVQTRQDHRFVPIGTV